MHAVTAHHVPASLTSAGQFDRRSFLARGALILAAAPGVTLAAGCGDERDRMLSPVFYSWILTLHPQIEQVNEDFRSATRLAGVVAPQEGIDIGDFVRESKRRTSSWDVFVGMTPWVEMARLAKANAIQPWDAHIEPELLRDILPRLRAEATIDGRLYSWPFLVDVTVQGWNDELVERAGLDPSRAPATWDEYIASARVVVESGVAPYGCTFDPRGWRSLAPIAHSIAARPYTDDGLFDYTHPATVEALEIMRRMVELSHPDVLEPEVVLPAVTPDEAAFGAQTVPYYVKYSNAHVRFASAWLDPARLRLAPLPAHGGPGGSVYWTIGIALFRHGGRKREAAAYARVLTHDERIWRRSLGTGRDAAGQLPAFRSLPGWSSPAPSWLAPWVPDVAAALRTATPIRPHPLGEQQFTVARPYWEAYLRGEESSPRRALARAMAAVRAKA